MFSINNMVQNVNFALTYFYFSIVVDHSRVKLHTADNDYINASLIIMEEAQRNYILTQVGIHRATVA